MTISSDSRKSPIYIGSGTTGPFAFSFKVFAASDVKVTTSVIATGVETELAAGAYSVLLNADQDGNPGGTVTLASALPATQNLVITSQVPLLQPVDINNQDGFFAEVIEDALDRSVMQVQQLKVDVDRAVKLPLTGSVTSADQLVQDIFDSVADAEAAELAAEAAQAAAETAQTNAETAETGAQTAETNAVAAAATAKSVSPRLFDTYADAVAAGLSNDDLFRLKIGERIFVYKFTTPGNYGVLQSVSPLNYPEATFASASSSGVTVAGTALPSGSVIDISGVDGSYSYSQIRNRAKTGLPSMNLLGTQDPSDATIRQFVVDTDPAGTGSFDINVDNELVVSHLPATGTDTYTVALPNIYVPPGRWTFAFDAKGIGGSYDFRASADGGSTYTSTLTATTTFQTFSITFDNTTEQADTFQFFREVAGTTSQSAIAYKNFRIVPGTSATYTEPANRHGWHKRPWSLETGSLVPTNDSESVDNLHTQVPLGETREITECTLSVAIRPTSNKPYQIANVTYPSAQPFSVLAQPSREFLPDYSVPAAPSLTYPYTSAGYLGFNNLGSTDDVVQVSGIAPPKDKFSVLTIVEPAEQGVNSSPTRIYLNGILLRNVEDSIQVNVSSVTNEGGKLRFNFGKPHYFVGDQPVTVTASGAGATVPGITAGVTYYVRLPATNPQEGLYLATSTTADAIDYSGASVGTIRVVSQKRPVGTVPFQLNTLSLLGAGTTESASIITGYDAGLNPVYSTVGLNMEGELANAVFYDKALTESEVQNLVAVQKQRIAAHYEPVSSLGSVLITEGDSITNGVGTASPNQTFRFRLFYGLDFTPQTTSSVTADGGGEMLLTFASNHGYETGDSVQVTSSNTLPTGLSATGLYYVQKQSNTTMYLSTGSLVSSPAISYTDAGIGNVTIKAFVPTPVNEAVKLNTIDFSVGGSRIGDTLGRKDALIAAVQRVVAEGSRPIVTYMAGINDLILGSILNPGNPITSAELASLVELQKDYWDDIRAAGAKLIVCTVTAANVGGALSGHYSEALRTELNNLIRAAGAKLIVCTVTAANVGGALSGHYSEALRTELNNLIRAASAHYDALADFGATPQVGTWQDPNDPPANPNSYFFDDIHPDFQGHIVMSNILSPLVDAFRL